MEDESLVTEATGREQQLSLSGYVEKLRLEKLTEESSPCAVQIGFSDELVPISSPAELGLSLPGYEFAGWSTSQDGTTGESYAPGSYVSAQSDLRLYAQWKLTAQTLLLEKHGSVGHVAGYAQAAEICSPRHSYLATASADAFDMSENAPDLSIRFKFRAPAAQVAGQRYSVVGFGQWDAGCGAFELELFDSGAFACRHQDGTASHTDKTSEWKSPTGESVGRVSLAQTWCDVRLSKTGKKLAYAAVLETGESTSSEVDVDFGGCERRSIEFGHRIWQIRTASYVETQTILSTWMVPAQPLEWKRSSSCAYYGSRDPNEPDQGTWYGSSVPSAVKHGSRSSCVRITQQFAAEHETTGHVQVDVEKPYEATCWDEWRSSDGCQFWFGDIADGYGLTCGDDVYQLRAW